MAAIDPNAEPQVDNDQKKIPPRATLKLIREPISGDDDESDDEDDSVEAIRARLGLIEEEEEDSEEDSEDDDEKNGGPSDPTKSKKARKEAAMKEILEELKNADDMDVDEKPKKNKGKARATDDEDSEEEDSDDEEMEMEEFVICTLDPEKVSSDAHSSYGSITDTAIALPAASGHHHRRERAGLLPGHWCLRHLVDW